MFYFFIINYDTAGGFAIVTPVGKTTWITFGPEGLRIALFTATTASAAPAADVVKV